MMKKYKIVYTAVQKGMQVIEDLTKQEMLHEVFDLHKKLDITNLYVEKLRS